MTEIFLACREERSTGDHLVVIKRLLPQLAQTDGFKKMFEREVLNLAGIDDPHVVRFLGRGEGDRREPFVVMEYVRGIDLAEVVRACLEQGRQVPVEAAVSIGLALCEALKAVHAADLIHGHVSPSNVVVSFRGRPKLIDFGSSQVTRGGLASPKAPTGSVRDMSPEQAMGVPVDVRTDLFSAGAVLYELLALESPFAAQDEYLQAQRLLLGDVEPLCDFVAGVSRELSDIIVRALSRDRQGRYATAADMETALLECSAKLDLRASEGELAAWVRGLQLPREAASPPRDVPLSPVPRAAPAPARSASPDR